MTIRILSKVFFSCLLLAGCSTSNSITPSSVPSQSKNNDRQKEFNIQSQDPSSLLRLAKGFEQSGDMINALKFYGQANVANPKLLEPWIGIIELLRVFENPVGARRALKDASIYHAGNPELAILAAEIEIADDKATDAMTLLARHMDRKDYRIANLLGVTSEMMGSPNLARKYYSDALVYNPSASGITNNLALSYSFYDDHKTAVSVLQKNLNDSSSRTLSYETLAIIYAMDNQLEAAVKIARSTLSDEEVSANFSFYQALSKLTPILRARAVFTRSIPVDALPYLNDKLQIKPEPEKVQELTKSERARQLVTQRFQDQVGEAPQTTSPPKVITLDRDKPNKSEGQRPELITRGEEITVSNESMDPSVSTDTHLTKEDESLSVTTPVTSLDVSDLSDEETASDEETVSEDKIESLPEMTIPKEKYKPLVEEIVPEEKTEPLSGSTVDETMLPEYKAESLPEAIVPEEKTESVSVTMTSEEKSEPIAEEVGLVDDTIEAKMEEPESITNEDMLLVESRNAYRVQIAAFTNIADAQKEWCRIAKRVSAAGVDDRPNVRVFGEGADTKYRLLLGEYDESADANATCEALKSQKLGCYVVKGAGQLRPLDGECKR